jgi:hypothetical protein
MVYLTTCDIYLDSGCVSLPRGKAIFPTASSLMIAEMSFLAIATAGRYYYKPRASN